MSAQAFKIWLGKSRNLSDDSPLDTGTQSVELGKGMNVWNPGSSLNGSSTFFLNKSHVRSVIPSLSKPISYECSCY